MADKDTAVSVMRLTTQNASSITHGYIGMSVAARIISIMVPVRCVPPNTT